MSSIGKNVICFALGTLFGSLGIKLLSSKDAKKVYTHATAAGLRVKDSVMKTVTTVQENVSDIVADAKVMNEERLKKEEAEVTVDLDCEETAKEAE